MDKPLWSILVPSSGDRLGKYAVELISNLESQIEDREIEILLFYDNAKRTIGGKRNSLLTIARGEFISFIDDDDLISNDYVSLVYEKLTSNSNTDLVTFNMVRRVVGNDPVICKHDPRITPPGYMDSGHWYGIPSHMMVWKNSIASSELFPNKNFGEDFDWMVKVTNKVKDFVNIDKVLYAYEFGRTSMPEQVYRDLGDPFAS